MSDMEYLVDQSRVDWPAVWDLAKFTGGGMVNGVDGWQSFQNALDLMSFRAPSHRAVFLRLIPGVACNANIDAFGALPVVFSTGERDSLRTMLASTRSPSAASSVVLDAVRPTPFPLEMSDDTADPYTLVMPTDLRDAWCSALVSGNYTQAKSYLREADGWCCLGVLCDITPGVTTCGSDDGDVFSYVWNDGEDSNTSLPPGFTRDLFGATIDIGDINCHLRRAAPATLERLAELSSPVREVTTLAYLNDDGASFDLIAQVIKECVPVVGVSPS